MLFTATMGHPPGLAPYHALNRLHLYRSTMNRASGFRSWIAALAAIALSAALLPLNSFAALGGNLASVRNDQVTMKAQIRTTHLATYDVHEMQTEGGTVVREFASPAGKVFAVAWQGPTWPDLQQVLGTHYDELMQAVRRQRRGRGPLFVETANSILQTGGHQRALRGRAYLKSDLPQGMNLQEIR